jgi:hypothetical protein
MKISHQEIMSTLGLKSMNTISHMKKNDRDRYDLICDGLRYRRLKDELKTDDVEGVVSKITEAVRTVSSLVARIKDIKAVTH